LLPVQALILEQEEIFSKFEKPFRFFLLFAERYLWDRHRPKINPLQSKYYIWIAGKKIAELTELQKGTMTRNKIRTYNSITISISINWIERLLQTPIADHRKFVSHWILSRYLINVKHI
jgi:hypothetical protein